MKAIEATSDGSSGSQVVIWGNIWNLLLGIRRDRQPVMPADV